MSSDDAFVNKQANINETNLDVAKEDRKAAESEVTGDVSKQEVEGLKDELGGGKVLDDAEGYTRTSNKDVKAMKGDEELDAKVDSLE